MKTPIALIFIAILTIATGVGAQDAKKASPPQVTPIPVLPSASIANLPSGRVINDATIPPTGAEQERLNRLGGQPLLWLKTMAAHHETSRKVPKSVPEKTANASPAPTSNKVAKRKKPSPKKTSVKAR